MRLPGVYARTLHYGAIGRFAVTLLPGDGKGREAMHGPMNARRWSNIELRSFASLLPGDVVNVSGAADADKNGSTYSSYFTAASSYSVTNYPGFRGFEGRPGEIPLDLSGPLPADLSQRFDVVFNHTTLEHIFEARNAFRHLCDMSRDLVIVVVPFAQVTHWSADFGDFWRFTPMGLRLLYEENRLEVIHEAASPMRAQDIYLLFVGSRNAAKWRGVLPSGRLDAPVGSWIAAHPWRVSVRHVGGRVLRRVHLR